MDARRLLPSVDQLLHREELIGLQKEYSRELLIQAVQVVLEEVRQDPNLEKKIHTGLDYRKLVLKVLNDWTAPTILPVINATGVILHTNLGRAPVSAATAQAMAQAATQYCTLEFDLNTGKRGSRTIHTADLLRKLTGAEDAAVVNNNAAAMLLVLAALVKHKRVIIPRSQLVEIGGGFRIPEVMSQSGAKLIEIGTTNRVHMEDYLQAIEDGADAVLQVHSSNFKIIGFTSEPEHREVVDLIHANDGLYIYDLGSGALLDTRPFGLSAEPTVQDAISAGSDIVCFSGDKLLGGPQAGIIVGRAELILRIKKHPLYRALRADKVCLAGLSATLLHYLKGEALNCIPIWRMISTASDEIRVRAEKWREFLGTGEVRESASTVGGGSLPGESLPTYVFTMKVENPEKWMKDLRNSNPPVIARIESDSVVFDPRTVFPEQEEQLLNTIKTLK